jgi:FMN phosphatase YigB (HAD superfamily)
MSLEQPVKQLLIDLDGTLLGNKPLPLTIDFMRQSIAALARFGGTRKAIGTLLAIQKEFKRPSKLLANDIRVVELCAQHLKVPADEARKFLRENIFKIFPTLHKYFFPVPGSKEFLDWAKDHYPLLLATNPVWPPEVNELRVRWAGIDPSIFKGMTHVRRMNACKPTPEYYEQILEQEGIKAKDCMLVGDDVKMDLPATRVGISVFIVGKYKRLSRLKPPKAKAPAWRGTYKDLRELLEASH